MERRSRWFRMRRYRNKSATVFTTRIYEPGNCNLHGNGITHYPLLGHKVDGNNESIFCTAVAATWTFQIRHRTTSGKRDVTTSPRSLCEGTPTVSSTSPTEYKVEEKIYCTTTVQLQPLVTQRSMHSQCDNGAIAATALRRG